jgi:LmbE family N-acetylglucosaminyl deacetylase
MDSECLICQAVNNRIAPGIHSTEPRKVVMSFDVIAFGAHPDDLEVSMGGTASILVASGRRVLFVDLTDGEPARYAPEGGRRENAARAAEILGVERLILGERDRLLRDSVASRLTVARLIREHRPGLVFGTQGDGVHPDHRALTDIVIGGAFYARLPNWDRVDGGEILSGTEPHEIDRLFFARCRMERPWTHFDFAVDVSGVYPKKLDSIRSYESVFQGDQASLVERYRAEDQYVGSLLGVQFAEPFKARTPLLVDSPATFLKVRFG